MFSRKAITVNLGDRFVKASDPRGKVWEVIRIRVTVDGIPHAQLVACDRRSVVQTISTLALQDGDYWQPAPAPVE